MPRGPQDLDGRICGSVFWVGLTPEEEAGLRARADAERSWSEWTAALRADLEATTDPLEIARLLERAGDGAARQQRNNRALDVPSELYRTAWSRLATSGALAPTHELVLMQFEKGFMRSSSVERSRAPAWRCTPDGEQYLDAEGTVWDGSRYLPPIVGVKAHAGTFAIPVGAPSRVSLQTQRGVAGPSHLWEVEGGTEVRFDAEAQERCFPSCLSGIVRPLLDA